MDQLWPRMGPGKKKLSSLMLQSNHLFKEGSSKALTGIKHIMEIKISIKIGISTLWLGWPKKTIGKVWVLLENQINPPKREQWEICTEFLEFLHNRLKNIWFHIKICYFNRSIAGSHKSSTQKYRHKVSLL